jgi:hypothetical protein
VRHAPSVETRQGPERRGRRCNRQRRAHLSREWRGPGQAAAVRRGWRFPPWERPQVRRSPPGVGQLRLRQDRQFRGTRGGLLSATRERPAAGLGMAAASVATPSSVQGPVVITTTC